MPEDIPNTAAVVVTPTTCKICNRTFASNPLHSAALLNANPQAKMGQIQAIISPLMQHLYKKHRENLEWTKLQGQEYAGLLAMNLFTCGEPIVEEIRDATRWKVHQLTRRVEVTDERIGERLFLAFCTAMRLDTKDQAEPPTDEQISVLGNEWLNSNLARQIFETMRAMRDVIQERGRYQMTDPAQPSQNGTKPS